jgi:hypothetical protein
MVRLSVYQEAEKAVQVHKWLASEKAGRDLGEEAVRDWTTSCWLQFYRWRFVQHLRGEVFWQEFDAAAFGIINGRLAAHRELLDEIIDRVRHGAENLDLIHWALQCGVPMDQLIGVLEALDINSHRLPPPRWTGATLPCR